MRYLSENVYSVKSSDLPKERHFVRDNAHPEEILHICERDLKGLYDEEEGTLVTVASSIWWDFHKGCYRCTGCKAHFRQYSDLFQIWQDGEGTGAEGHS